MDGNKDEALRCFRIAEEAIAIGNKDRALKFIKIAQRLNHNLPLDSLLNQCHRLDSQSSSVTNRATATTSAAKAGAADNEGLNGERNYSDENVQLIREIKGRSDYYAILGVEKSSSVEEIRKAYRKISLKVHPDKNKAPGSEDAFKKVSKAFKCLSDDISRRQYDQTGLVDEFEYSQQCNTNVRHRRRRTTTARDFFEDEFDPDEIFRAFFGQSNVFDRTRVYRTRATTSNHNRQESQGGSGLKIMLLIQLLPFLIVLLLAYLPFLESDYSLHENYPYQILKTTEVYGVQYFVKSQGFDSNYPSGSPARAKIEDNVIKDYSNMLHHYCQTEMQRRTWNRNLPTPHCEKLKSFRVASA
ncbi:hypothetical protein TanjilG_21597 [Lupinus angustifolius]|uniref:J domain-containing protein n=1 Tax=Lupinus angustifolius TaxID=3871 RepID=A0A4P1QV41_LUPAN|nr:PREDICTED: chaperone protein dnaJ 49-like [Lupinus angustifolius]OIV95207.1 hypothetical protein TanjilG_21597 [Lupinus angustifolius]